MSKRCSRNWGWIATWLSRRQTNERGQSVVEFALVAPFLILALALAFQIAFMSYAKIIASNAAQEGARSAAVHSFPGEGVIRRTRVQAVENVVRVRCIEVMPFFSAPDAVTWTVEPESEGSLLDDVKNNRVVRVTVTVRVPNLTMVYPGPITVQGVGIAYIEPWPGPFRESENDITPAPGNWDVE